MISNIPTKTIDNLPNRQSRLGMTLIEVSLAIAILAIALIAVLGVLVQAQEANVLNRSRVIAFDQAHAVLDEIRDLKALGLAFPDGILEKIPAGKLPLANNILDNAWRSVEYGAKTDPLMLTVTVHWLDMRGREASISLSSAVAKN